MSNPDELDVSAATDKPSYANGEVPEFSASARTKAGEPVAADVQWGLRVLPDGKWVDYSREYPVSTHPDTGAATWHWPDDEFGPPDPGDYEMSVDARSFDDNGNMTGEGEAELKFRVEQP
jgi:hypothetical protein